MLNRLANIVAELGRPSWPRICRNRGQRHIAVIGTDAMGKQIICHRAHTSEDAYHGFELMRWMPPPSGISYAMMVSSKPNGGHIDDGTDQHAGDRPGEGQLPSLRNRSGWGVCGCPLFG